MNDPTLPANMREFHCQHCRGKIRIPKALPATTGPCPHCQGIITSPVPETAAAVSALPPAPVGPLPPQQQPSYTVAPLPAAAPITAPVDEPPPAYLPPTQSSQPAVAPPLEHLPISQPVSGSPTADSVAQEPVLSSPTVQRGSSKKAETRADAKKSSATPAIFLGCLLLAIASGAGFLVFKEMKNRTVSPPAPTSKPSSALSESQYIRIGWQKDALSVLNKFLAAKTASEKIPYIINGEQLRSQVEAFYGGSVINDQDTPVDAFSVMELSEEDRKRGIFMLVFDQPPQFEMKEFFRPLATLELQYGLNEADLLFSTVARVENFATEPVRATALFKKTPDGLKLDWETFAQTKYRTFRNFVELPEAGQTGTFRVIISEDVPESGRSLPAGIKTYRIWDPSAPETSTRVNVNIDSEIGRILSKIDWRGKENRPTNSTATIKLKWIGQDQPKLEISRFICWEFLHLGGTELPAAAR